jgi:hypothetical protein
MKNTRFQYYMPFCKMIGLRLSRWTFLCLFVIPEKVSFLDIGHFDLPLSEGSYQWYKIRPVFRLIPVR